MVKETIESVGNLVFKIIYEDNIYSMKEFIRYRVLFFISLFICLGLFWKALDPFIIFLAPYVWLICVIYFIAIFLFLFSMRDKRDFRLWAIYLLFIIAFVISMIYFNNNYWWLIFITFFLLGCSIHRILFVQNEENIDEMINFLDNTEKFAKEGKFEKIQKERKKMKEKLSKNIYSQFKEKTKKFGLYYIFALLFVITLILDVFFFGHLSFHLISFFLSKLDLSLNIQGSFSIIMSIILFLFIVAIFQYFELILRNASTNSTASGIDKFKFSFLFTLMMMVIMSTYPGILISKSFHGPFYSKYQAKIVLGRINPNTLKKRHLERFQRFNGENYPEFIKNFYGFELDKPIFCLSSEKKWLIAIYGDYFYILYLRKKEGNGQKDVKREIEFYVKELDIKFEWG